MLRRLSVFTLFLIPATPAFATSTLECTAAGRPVLRLVVADAGITDATLINGAHEMSSARPNPAITIGQSWIDRQELKADIFDGNVEQQIATLRTRAQGAGVYAGTLVWRGRTQQVRCSEEG